ncbi:hypothetical protein BESB_052560 [Besnoitia besnoiti]|uniref:Kinesin motor domain-containing protein n=1 Tax=Besnoitia besnoiti TaxID=94643 RepID=A0A2A9MCA1_BESBE|nr:hypothetical protein BESB_052560 [Besnoitia besnoiti]PFH35605.1 hypothetical protein BESB_052560 [Besnoitia besnoiti]
MSATSLSTEPEFAACGEHASFVVYGPGRSETSSLFGGTGSGAQDGILFLAVEDLFSKLLLKQLSGLRGPIAAEAYRASMRRILCHFRRASKGCFPFYYPQQKRVTKDAQCVTGRLTFLDIGANSASVVKRHGSCLEADRGAVSPPDALARAIFRAVVDSDPAHSPRLPREPRGNAKFARIIQNILEVSSLTSLLVCINPTPGGYEAAQQACDELTQEMFEAKEAAKNRVGGTQRSSQAPQHLFPMANATEIRLERELITTCTRTGRRSKELKTD